jgi:hypothetical protein
MHRAQAWSLAEFEIVLQNATLSSQKLEQLLSELNGDSRRSYEAIEVVRQGIHSYHRSGNISMLSKLMVQRLEETDRQPVTCAVCEIQF